MTDKSIPLDGAPARVRHPAFTSIPYRLFWSARLAAGLAIQMQAVAVGWHIYALTGSALNLGMVGLTQFLPSIGLALITGHVADRFDRRRVLAVCYFVELSAMAVLAVQAAVGATQVWPIYLAVLMLGAGRAFEMPSGQALMPNLVPVAHFPNAVTWNSMTMQGASILGPALGGVLYIFGAAFVFGLCTLLLALALCAVAAIRIPRRIVERRPATWATLVAGIGFIGRRPMILGAISLDLFAVLLGGATALLPIVAYDGLQAGPAMLGVLRSAPAAGALVTGIALAWWPLKRHVGAIMLVSVALFGLATIVFGLAGVFGPAGSLPVALAALMVMGASDMVSVVIRQSVVQLWTPDEMRGRVAAVNSLFIGASNQLGEFESGVTAAWFGAVPAIVLGGLGTLAVVGLWTLLFPALRRIDRLLPERGGE